MALDGGQIGTWDLDLKNDAVRWAGHAARVFNVVQGNEPLRFEVFLELVHPEDRPALTEAVRQSHNVRQLTIAPLMAEAILRISEERSVSSLFG